MSRLSKAVGPLRPFVSESLWADVYVFKEWLSWRLSRARKSEERWDPRRSLIGKQTDGDDPVFVLSAGWRSGSTLLQRLVLSARRWLIWGEPYGDMMLLSALAERLKRLGNDWPPDDYVLDATRGTKDLQDQWIANMYPPPHCVVDGARSLLESSFAAPAHALDWPGWGFKEVRFGYDEAVLLSSMYPAGKFVMIVRNPFDAWQSYATSYRGTYFRWPDDRVFGASHFGRLWSELASDLDAFVDCHRGILVRYEDLTCDGGETFARIQSYLDVELDRDVLSHNVGTHRARSSYRELTSLTKAVLGGSTRETRLKFGY